MRSTPNLSPLSRMRCLPRYMGLMPRFAAAPLGAASPSMDIAYFHSKNNNPVLENAIPVLGVKPRRGWYVFLLFFKTGLRSAISFKRSRREFSIGVTVSVLKNNQNTLYPRFSLTPKTDSAFPLNGSFVFTVLIAATAAEASGLTTLKP